MKGAGMGMGLLGADTVVGEGQEAGVMNKSGSLLLVLAAAHYKVPVVVLTSLLKCNSAIDKEDDVEENDPQEVTASYRDANLTPGRTTRVRNIYFEKVPLSLVDHVVSEEGVVAGVKGLEAMARENRERFEKLFYT